MREPGLEAEEPRTYKSGPRLGGLFRDTLKQLHINQTWLNALCSPDRA